jgi:transglutaminase/protease-like cytokinesis protein 3
MKKIILSFLTCLFCTNTIVQAQIESNNKINTETAKTLTVDPLTEKNYSVIDAYALSLTKKYTDLYELAADLTGKYAGQEEKVRAIYRWITDNISFDYKDLNRGVTTAQRIYKKHKYAEDFKYSLALKTLRDKKGVCIGYSALFYELCRISGIKCSIIEGAADDNIKKIAYYRKTYFYYPNHAWNSILLNNQLYYIDVTWSSGQCSSRKYFKNFNPDYYLTPKLYLTHVENKY